MVCIHIVVKLAHCLGAETRHGLLNIHDVITSLFMGHPVFMLFDSFGLVMIMNSTMVIARVCRFASDAENFVVYSVLVCFWLKWLFSWRCSAGNRTRSGGLFPAVMMPNRKPTQIPTASLTRNALAQPELSAVRPTNPGGT